MDFARARGPHEYQSYTKILKDGIDAGLYSHYSSFMVFARGVNVLGKRQLKDKIVGGVWRSALSKINTFVV